MGELSILERVEAAWIISDAPECIAKRVADGWRPVLHECIEAPQWNKDGYATETMSTREVEWFAPGLTGALPESLAAECAEVHIRQFGEGGGQT